MEGITKTFTVAGTKGVSARVTVTEQYDIAANTSTLQVAVALACASYYGHTYYLTGHVSADKKLQTMKSGDGTHFVTVSKLDTYYPIKAAASAYTGSPWTCTVAHGSDGSKTVTVSVDITGYEPSGKGANGFTVTGSQSVTLTAIPRASTVAATDAAIESVSAVSVSRKASGYTHTVGYAFGNLTGYLTASGGTSGDPVKLTATGIPFSIPQSFYAQIPNSKTGSCTLTCRTYYGDTQIGGDQTCSFTVTASKARCAPAVSGGVTDSNAATVALTGDQNVLVRYMSNARCEITAQAKNSASITGKVVGGNTTTGTVQTIKNTEKDSYLFSATDSRGYETAVTVKKTLIPYIKLTCNLKGKRTNPTDGTATLTVKGSYFDGSFGAKANTLTVSYRPSGGSWQTVTPTVADGSYIATASLTGLDYTRSHLFEVKVSDQLMTLEESVRIQRGVPVFDWGQYDFHFRVPVRCEQPYDISAAQLDRTTDNGWYRIANDPLTVCGYTANDWYVHVVKYNISHLVQELYTLTGYKLIRTCRAGTWTQAWEHPPMQAGVEYPTTQLWKNAQVYVTELDFASLPSSGYTGVDLGTGLNVIAIEGVAYSEEYVCPLGNCDAIKEVWYQESNGNIYISVRNSTAADYKACVVVRYTKP